MLPKTSKPRISLIHPIGNPNARSAAEALAEAGLLHEIITSIAFNPKGSIAQFLRRMPKPLGAAVLRELERRAWVAPAGAVLQSHPWQEAARIALMKSGLVNRLGWNRQSLADGIFMSIDRHAADHHLSGLDAVYAYEDGAACTFKAAKQQGIHCFYDLPILFYQMARAIQAEEAERFPELADSLQAVREPAWKLERKALELQLADHIFVASSITQRSVLEAGVPADKISVIPYGAPIDYFQPHPKRDAQFRALFVGRVGARKGVHYLLQAWKSLRLPDAELMLVGIHEFPQSWMNQSFDGVRYVPSVPHTALNQYYSSASVFVFPSLVEGFGLVLLEAMACGIPIIATPHTAAPDLITEGVEGFIVPIRDPIALQEKLEWCYRHPEELAAMGRAARRKAEQLTWQQYQTALAHRVVEVMNEK